MMRYFILSFLFLNVFFTYALRNGNDEKWNKTYRAIANRYLDNPDSCANASKAFLSEVTQANNTPWRSKALSVLGASEYNQNDFINAARHLNESVLLQEEINDAEVLGRCFYYLANITYSDKNYSDAEGLWKKAISNLGIWGNKWLEGNAHFLLGYTYFKLNEFTKAPEEYKLAAEIFEGYVNSKVLADVYYFWGDVEYFNNKNYEKGAELFEKSAVVYDDKDMPAEAAYSRFLEAEIFNFYLIKKKDAVTNYAKAFAFYIKGDNKERIAKIGKAMGDLCYDIGEFQTGIPGLLEAAKINNELGKFAKEGDCQIVLANMYYFSGNYPDALTFYRKSLDSYQKENSKSGMAGSYVGLGNFYQSRNDLDKAIEMFSKSIALYEESETPNNIGLSSANIGLGNVFYDRKDYEKALQHYLKAVEYSSKVEDADKSVALMNISNIYTSRNDEENALKYLEMAIAESEKMGNQHRLGSAYSSRGFFYNRKKEYQKAFEDCTKALDIETKLDLKPEMMDCYRCLYHATYNLGNYKDAVSHYSNYIATRDSINNEKRNTEINKRELAYEYEMKQAALKMEEQKKQFALQEELKRKQMVYEMERERASIQSRAEKRELEMKEEYKRKQLSVEYEKKRQSAKISREKEEMKLKHSIAEKELRNKEQKKLNNWLFTGLAIFGVFILVILKGFRDKQKANKVILKQKEETEHQKEVIELKSLQIEEKNREIVDSINYAKRLQEAILPPHKLVKQYLNDSFILYKPRDIVAGDFYWMETIANKLDFLLFAVADCTGHGVPGAMVSVVCSGALNRAVKEFHLTEPGPILDKVRELVIETFEKSEAEVKDGMDISLCALNLETLELLWAGANNPLWILEGKKVSSFNYSVDNFEDIPSPANWNEVGLAELKPDKQPIGKMENTRPFKTHIVKLQKGDLLYMSTDGYSDQFGGYKGKKFKDANLKKLLLAVAKLPIEKQAKHLDDSFEKWRGNLEQVDDVCIIGIRV